jgi:hypothetical protein
VGLAFVQILLIISIGIIFYQIVRAMELRPLAEIIKLSCWALCLVNIVQILLYLTEAVKGGVERVSNSLDALASTYQAVADILGPIVSQIRK